LLSMALAGDFIIQGFARLEWIDTEPTGIASLAVIAETLGIWNVGALGKLARINEAVDWICTLVDWRIQDHVAGFGHGCSYSGSIGGPVASDVVGMVTEAIQMIVLQRILAVVQPHIVRLALIESAAVIGNECGEVSVPAKSCVVTEIDGTSAIFRHSSSFREVRSTVATDIPWLIAESIQMVV